MAYDQNSAYHQPSRRPPPSHPGPGRGPPPQQQGYYEGHDAYGYEGYGQQDGYQNGYSDQYYEGDYHGYQQAPPRGQPRPMARGGRGPRPAPGQRPPPHQYDDRHGARRPPQGRPPPGRPPQGRQPGRGPPPHQQQHHDRNGYGQAYDQQYDHAQYQDQGWIRDQGYDQNYDQSYDQGYDQNYHNQYPEREQHPPPPAPPEQAAPRRKPMNPPLQTGGSARRNADNPFPTFPEPGKRSDVKDATTGMADMRVNDGLQRQASKESHGTDQRRPPPMPLQSPSRDDRGAYSQGPPSAPPTQSNFDFGIQRSQTTALETMHGGQDGWALGSGHPRAPPGQPPAGPLPPRPSTAAGTKPSSHRAPAIPAAPYSPPKYDEPQEDQGGYWNRHDSFVPPHPMTREEAIEAEMPNFESADSPPTHPPANSIDQHLNSQSYPVRSATQDDVRGGNGVYGNLHAARSQPNLRSHTAPPLAANAPPVPPLGFVQRDPRGPAPSPYHGGPQMNQRPPPGGNGYPPGPPPGNRVPPRRPMPGPGGRPPPGAQQQYGRNPDVLPSHPAPVRPGLMEGSAVAQQSRPPPVRQYQSAPAPQQQDSGSSQQPAPDAQDPDAEPPVTHAELNALRGLVQNGTSQANTLQLAKKLVEATVVLADEGGKVDVRQRNKNREKYIMEAHKLVKKLVSQGYADGMFYLADCYGSGQLGLAPDPKEAFSLYQAAAKAGHAVAAYRTAVCCEIGAEEGGGTRRDAMKAVQWYKRAASLGNVPAMYKVGMITLKGLLGQQRNPAEAVTWLKRAADHADAENPHALHELALLHETASGNDRIVRDERYALQLFKQAADLGYKFSQFRLAQAYEFGHLGAPIDPRASIAWYTRAASAEEHQSELALSGWYLTGAQGILGQSDTEAYLWARKAAGADPPLAKALFAMGYYTEVGIGCPNSLEEAKRWYGRAAAYKHPKAQERLDALRKGGAKSQKGRERISRSDPKKHENECAVM